MGRLAAGAEHRALHPGLEGAVQGPLVHHGHPGVCDLQPLQGLQNSGRLRLGISVQRAMQVLPLALPWFAVQFPHVTLEITERGSAHLEELVRWNGAFYPLKDYENHRHFYACYPKDEHLPRYAAGFTRIVSQVLSQKALIAGQQ